jgi:tetratricopeptide (TPR) repeat protein
MTLPALSARARLPCGTALAALLLAAARATTVEAPAAAATITPGPVQPAAVGAVASDNEEHGLLNLGNALTERGDYAAAEIAFRRVLNAAEATPAGQAEGLLGLGRLYRRSGAFVKAAAVYEKFLKQYPEDQQVPDALLELGRTLRAMGAHRLAISRFYSVINSTLKIPTGGFEHYQLLAKTAQFEIAETHFDSGDYAEAGKFYSRVRLLDLAPADRARAHFKAAVALDLAGNHEGALTTVRAYLEQWPDDDNVPEARYLLATTLRQLNRPAEALAATLDLLRAEQDRNDPRRWAYWQRRTGNQLANEFFQQGDTRTALAIYQGLVPLSEEAAWRLPIVYQTALCYERLGQIERAHGAFQSIVDTVQADKAAPQDQVELGRLAGWRLTHMAWADETVTRLNVFFNTTGAADKAPAAPPAVSPAPTPDTHGSPAPAPEPVR